MRIGIRRLFLLNSAVTAILPIICIGLVSLAAIRYQLIKNSDVSSVTLARSVSNQITTYLQEPAATFDFLSRHLYDQRHSPEEASRILENITDSYNYFESLYLLDSHGKVTVAGFEKSGNIRKIDYLGMDFSSVEICRKAMKEQQLNWQSTLSVSSGEPTLSFCAPLSEGTVLATLRLSNLGRIINTASSGRRYDSFVVDNRGRIIAHPDHEVVLHQDNISNLPIIREALEGKTSSGDFVLKNSSYRGSAVTIDGFNWVLVVAQDLDVAMAPVRVLEKIFLAGIFAMLFMAMIVSSIASSMLSRPFAQLSENARHVINEEYEKISPISSSSREIMLFSDTLHTMVDAVRTREAKLNEQTEELMMKEETLRELNQNLEQKVRERTKRLAETMEELNALNSDLVQRSTALENANHQLESFAYSISHDLRAPLRHVSSFTSILAEEYRETLDKQGKDYIRRIVNSCSKMDELIDAILEFARVSRQAINVSSVDMSGLVNEVLEEFRSEIDHYHVETVVGILPVCRADLVLIKQVFANLIGNALKYSRKRENPRVEIGASTEDGEIRFYVKDNGAGFDMKYAGKLFGVFSRLHRQEDFEGVGVGLAIVRNIINRHDGRIWAEAELDRGATFYFSIPA